MIFPEFTRLTQLKSEFSNRKEQFKLDFTYPPKLTSFVESQKMYQVLYGGRSSAKTRSALQKILEQAANIPNQTILCTREYQASIQTSTYAELKQIIYEKNLQHIFRVKHDRIECINGTQFIFKGLARDIMQIKSIPNIDICLVEEAETIGRELWEILNPTLRKEGSQLIVLFNPREKQSSTYQIWLEEEIPEDDILRIEINYYDNPFNSETILKKIEHMKKHDYARYEHIYLGKVLDISEDVIFKGKFKILDIGLERIGDKYFYQNKQIGMIYGMDFGFSVDPAAMIELCFLDENTIYIYNEIYQTGILPNNYIKFIEKNLGKYALNSHWFGDAARPDTIAQLKHDGLKIDSAPKGKGSIEAGIQYLLGKNIIIHPRCTNMIFEAYNYRYKKDKNSGIVLSEIIDAHNHCLVGNTLIDTIDGKIMIKDLVGKSGKVWSFNEENGNSEINNFFDVRMTQESSQIFEIELEDGRIIQATDYHPFLTKRGWILLKDLTIEDEILNIELHL